MPAVPVSMPSDVRATWRYHAHPFSLSYPNPATFDICKNNTHVAQFRLFRSVFRLGDVISATVDFARNDINCYQFSVFLESREVIETAAMTRPIPQETLQRFTRRIHAEHHEFCLHTRRTNIALCIPTNGSPDFSTNLGMLRRGRARRGRARRGASVRRPSV